MTNIFEILKKWADETGHDGARLEAVLTTVADEEKIVLKLHDAPKVSGSEDVRTILDVESISFDHVKGTTGRTIAIAPGVTGLFGGNDSGKTTAQLAARWLIGGQRAVGQGIDERMIQAGHEQMGGTLRLVGDRTIVRGISRKVVKKGKDAGQTKVSRDLVVKLNGHAEDQIAKAQLEIDTYLGGDLAFALSIAFLEQGLLTQMIDSDPAARKEAVYRLLGLAASEHTAKALREVAKRVHGAREADLVNRATHVKVIGDQTRLLEQSPPREKLEAEVARLAPAAVGASPADLDAVKRINAQIAEIENMPAWKIDPAAALPDVAALTADWKAKGQKAEMLSAEAEGLRLRYRTVHALPGKCDTCAAMGKDCDVTPEWKAATLKQIREDGSARAKEASAALEATKTAGIAVDAAEFAHRERSMYGPLRAGLAQRRAQLVADRDATPQTPAPDPSTVEAHAWGVQKLREMDAAQGKIDAARAVIAEIDKDESRIVEMDGLTGAGERDALDTLVQAFSRDGIPLWLARAHVGRVNEIAREIAIGDRYVYAFGPELDVQVFDTQQALALIAPKLASGSSRERGALVLAAAMSLYQQELAKIRCPLLWIDELPFQDEVNAVQLADTLKRLGKWFERIVFAASDWAHYEGKFDHEVWLARPLDEAAKSKQARAAALEKDGQAQLAPPAPEVKTYGPMVITPEVIQAAKDAGPLPGPTYMQVQREIDERIKQAAPEPTPAQVDAARAKDAETVVSLKRDLDALGADLGLEPDPGF